MFLLCLSPITATEIMPEVDPESVDLNSSRSKLDTNSGLGVEIELVARKPRKYCIVLLNEIIRLVLFALTVTVQAFHRSKKKSNTGECTCTCTHDLPTPESPISTTFETQC